MEVLRRPELTDEQRNLIAAMAFCNLHITQAAKTLGWGYARTVARLDDLESQTGKNPRDFFDLHELYEMAGS